MKSKEARQANEVDTHLSGKSSMGKSNVLAGAFSISDLDFKAKSKQSCNHSWHMQGGNA